MSWNPSVPPAETFTGNSVAATGWEDLRFVMVKLDNFTMHLNKPKWGCANISSSTYHGKWPGSAATLNLNTHPSNMQGAGCPNPSLPAQANRGGSCIPMTGFSSGNQNTTWAAATPSYGFLSMASCISGYNPNAGSMSYFEADECWVCKPGSSTCSSPNQINYSDTAAAANFVAGGQYWYHGSDLMPTIGKGPYDETHWFWQNHTDYSGGTPVTHGTIATGMTMWDIAGTGAFRSGINYGNALGGLPSNVIHPSNDPGFVDTQHMSYYAIILFPTNPDDAAAPQDIASRYTFKLHQELDTPAWSKFLGKNFAGDPSDQFPTGTPNPNVGFEAWYPDIGSWDPIGNLGDGTDWRLATSNTGVQHFEDGNSSGLDDWGVLPHIGGILDGEFIDLDDPWWDRGAGASGTNPFDIEILSDIQKHMIVSSTYDRYRADFTPSYTDRFSTILVTKTPAMATEWDVFNTSFFFASPNIVEDDHPYFDLHITKNTTQGGGSTGTLVLDNVATGLQDRARDHFSGVTLNGIGRYQGLDTLTLSSQLSKGYIGTIADIIKGNATVPDLEVHTLRTAGFDSHIIDTGSFGSGVTPTDFYAAQPMSSSTNGAYQGIFYDFDSRVDLKGTSSSPKRDSNVYLLNAANGLTFHAGKHILATTTKWTSGQPTSGSTGTYYDHNFSITYLGIKKYISGGGWAYPSSYSYAATQREDDYYANEYLTPVNTTAAATYHWPDDSNLIFPPSTSGALAFKTNVTGVEAKFAITTGNGLIFNSAPPCPVYTLSETVFSGCTSGVMISNLDDSIVYDNITIGANSTSNATSNGGEWEIYSGVGTYPFTITASVTHPNGCFWTEDIILTGPDVSYNVNSVVGTNPTTVGGSDGTILLNFDASNNTSSFSWNAYGLVVTVMDMGTGLPEPGFNQISPFSSGSNIFAANSSLTGATFLITGLPEGTYNVVMHQATIPVATCSSWLQTILSDPSPMSCTVSIVTANCPTGTTPYNSATNTVDVTINVTGGSPAFSYNLTDPGGSNIVPAVSTSNTSYTFTNVDISPYINFTVLVYDSTSDSCQSVHTIPFPTAFSCAGPSVTQPPCSGGTGTITSAVPTGGTAPYTYQLLPSSTSTVTAVGQNSNVFNNVSPGTYYVFIVDANGCVHPVTAPAVINSGSALTVLSTATSPTCPGGTGSITLAVSGGTAPYTYSWVGPNGYTSTSQNISALVDTGTYTCTVDDFNGCGPMTVSDTLTVPVPMVITASVSSISCGAAGTGSIDITVTGGTAPYNYIWSNGATTQDINSLNVGTYNVIVGDSNGCSATGAWSIINTGGAEAFLDFNQHEYDLQYTQAITGTTLEDLTYGLYGGPTCANSDDGTIRIIMDSSTGISGAAFPYDVWLSDDGGANYYQVTDAGGTNLSMTMTDAYDTSTGIVSSTGLSYDHLTAVNGVDYFELNNTMKWNPGGGVVTLPLVAWSTWDIKLVESGALCDSFFSTQILPTDHMPVDISTISPIITQPNCCGCSSYNASAVNVCDGGINITPIHGTYEDHTNNNYTYSWSYANLPSTCTVPGHINHNTLWSTLTTQDISAEWPGIYTPTVTDSCGSTDTVDITLNDPVVYIDDITWVHPQCADCPDGEITVVAHGGSGNLEISIDNGSTWTPMTSTYTVTGLNAGIYSIWVRDDSGCAVEYFADPDDSSFLASYDDNCHANVNQAGIITISGTWAPTNNALTGGTPFSESSPTKIKLEALSDFTGAAACIHQHNVIPGDTNGHITLDLLGGVPPYEISVTAQIGPIYDPAVGMLPCSGIGPLSTINACSLTNTTIPGNGLAGTSVWEVEDDYSGTYNVFSATQPYVTSGTHFDIQNVSVSRDLGFGGLGAEYIFYIKDSVGCFQTAHVGMDNGMFGLISIYGAETCDCICPPGFVIDSDPGSSTNGECISTVIEPITQNFASGNNGYWTLSKNLYTGQAVPASWQTTGAVLYGAWDTSTSTVNYGASLNIDINKLPIKKDIATITANLLYADSTTTPVIGVDTTQWIVNSGSPSALATRLQDIAVWLNQASPAPVPPIPTGEWIGSIMEINYGVATEAIIALACDEKMIMSIDGIPHIYMDGDDTNPTTVTSNYSQLNLFPLILPAGLHTISFEVFNTSGDAFMAYEIYSNTCATGNYFVAEASTAAMTLGVLEASVLLDINGDKISSKTLDTKEIQLGDVNYGFSCSGGNVVGMASSNMFCMSDVTAPCEVPLDCGRCTTDVGLPAPDWTKKGPCEDATDNAGIILGNEWLTDDSKLSELVECPAALANETLNRIEGALATNVLSVRQVWITIMIKYMFKNLNTCMTIEDIQDIFAGFLDEVCPTCNVKGSLTPAEMESISQIFILNNNSQFDF